MTLNDLIGDLKLYAFIAGTSSVPFVLYGMVTWNMTYVVHGGAALILACTAWGLLTRWEEGNSVR
jgi:hypothetical protein